METYLFVVSDKTKLADVCAPETANNNSDWPHYIWLDDANFSVKQPWKQTSLLELHF